MTVLSGAPASPIPSDPPPPDLTGGDGVSPGALLEPEIMGRNSTATPDHADDRMATFCRFFFGMTSALGMRCFTLIPGGLLLDSPGGIPESGRFLIRFWSEAVA